LGKTIYLWKRSKRKTTYLGEEGKGKTAYLRKRTIFLRMTAYSMSVRKTSSMQASSHTSRAVTVFDTGIRVLNKIDWVI
jgi:hypothetical protein